MNSNRRVTTQLRVGVPRDLKQRLRLLAQKQRRSLSSAVRVLLEEAMDLEETLMPADPKRSEYEINLTVTQAARMIRKGYDIQIWDPKYTQGTLL